MPDILTVELTFGQFNFGTATETNTGLKRKTIWIGVPANNPFADPVLTMTSTPGTNPPTWSAVMADLQVGDRVQLDFTSNGSAPDGVAEETHDPVTSDEAILGDISWSTFTGFAGSSTVKWRQRYGRTISGTQVWSNWSNTLSDVVGAAAFLPSTLFGASDVGYAFDTTDGSKIWQNVAGTTPGAFTSVVGNVTDISGKGNNLIAQGDNVTRPTWANVNNGLILFDGADDKLTGIGGFYAKGAMTWVGVVKVAASSRFMWAETSTGSTNPVYAPGLRGSNATNVLNYQRNDAATALATSVLASLMDGTAHMYMIEDTGTQLTIWVDGVQASQTSYSRNAPLTGNVSAFGNAIVAGADFTLSISGSIGSPFVIGRLLTGAGPSTASSEKKSIYNYIAAKHGLATL